MSVVIPAYNEAPRVAAVIRAAKACPVVGEVIVVDDGSEDATKDAAHQAGARVLLSDHRGKGHAMRAGAQHAKCPTVVFLDGDLSGLTPAHIGALAGPAATGRCDMTIGQIDGQSAPLVRNTSGQRSMRCEVAAGLVRLDASGYGAEAVLTSAVEQQGGRIEVVRLHGVTHPRKLAKLGLVNGVVGFGRTVIEVFLASYAQGAYRGGVAG